MSNLNVGLQASTKLISLLTESKSRLELNLTEFDGIFIIMNEKLSILQSNKAVDEVFDGDSFRCNFADAISKEFLNEFQNKAQRVLDGKHTESMELRLHNEKLYLIKISQFQSIRKEEGKILKITGLDITGIRDLESQIVDVLKTINFGVMFIDQNNKIMPGYSEYSRIMFERDDLVGLDLHELLFNHAITIFKEDEKNAINSLKSIVGKSEMDFTILSFTLPGQVEIKSEFNDSGSKYIKITVEPVTIDGVISRYMIVAQDVTALINTKELTFSKDIGSFYYELEINSSSVDDMMRDLRALVDRIPDEFIMPIDPEVKGLLHSIKGTLGMNGLNFLSKIIHNMETDVVGLKSDEEIGSLNTKYLQFKHYYRLLNELYDGALANDKSTNGDKKLLDVDMKLIEKIPSHYQRHYFFSLSHFQKKNSFESLKKLEQVASSLNERNQGLFPVECELTLDTPDDLIHMEAFQSLKTTLIHLINNSFSHGFEADASERVINVNIKRAGSTFEILYKDNGQGVNVEKLRSKLISAGEDKKNIDLLNDQEVANLIFKSGLSTKDEVTEIAGRGEGLSGVFLDLNRIGGNINLSEFSNGCEFQINVPRVPASRIENIVVGSDLVACALSLYVDKKYLDQIELDAGLYRFRSVEMFFQALSSMKEIFNEKSSDNQESIQMVNKTLALNDCELIVGQALPVLKLNNKVQGFDQFDIPSSLFPSEKAFNIAAKESEEALGVSLNLLGDHFMDKTSYFKLVDNEVTPSILRFIETSIENVK